MANVLPVTSQKKVWAMYRSRLVLVTSLVLLGLALATALTLFPSYVALQIAASSEAGASVALEEDRTNAFALERSQFLIRELRPIVASASSSMSAVEAALAVKPAGVRITRIIYMGSEDEGRVTFVGTASRDQVSAYKDALTNSGLYTSVSVPVGALVGSEGGGFSIVFSGAF